MRKLGVAIDQDEGRIHSRGLRIDLIVLGMGPEESDCQGSCLILYACNQSVVVALDVEHHSAAGVELFPHIGERR